MTKRKRILSLSPLVLVLSDVYDCEGFNAGSIYSTTFNQQQQQQTKCCNHHNIVLPALSLSTPITSTNGASYINGYATTNTNTTESTTYDIRHDDEEEETRISNVPLVLSELNVLYGIRTSVAYDPRKDQFISTKRSSNTNIQQQQQQQQDDDDDTNHSKLSFLTKNIPIYDIIFHRILPRLRVSFLPCGVTSNYYSFMKWRIIQRFVNANLHVFGTQSLLLGLGIKANMNSRLGALSAALHWIVKDALGEIVRMIWASKNFIQHQRYINEQIRQQHCHIVLHSHATNTDIVKSTVALVLLRQLLSKFVRNNPSVNIDTIRSNDCYPILQESLDQTNEIYSSFLNDLTQSGWESSTKLMVARVNMRAEWPIQYTNNAASQAK